MFIIVYLKHKGVHQQSDCKLARWV